VIVEELPIIVEAAKAASGQNNFSSKNIHFSGNPGAG
jgi:hypothetical protein